MIKFIFKNKEYSFSGFNCEANWDGEMLNINGDKNDFQFAIELPSNQIKTYSKNDEGVSITFDFPEGEQSFSAYNEDGNEQTKVNIILSAYNNKVEGKFEAVLAGEDNVEKLTNGEFSINIEMD